MRSFALVALLVLSACDLFHTTVSGPGIVAPSPQAAGDDAKAVREVQELLGRGDIGQAVEAASRAVAAAEQRSQDPNARAPSLQMLGLALAAAERTDEALEVSGRLKGIPGNLSWMNVESAVASARCSYGEAGDLQLKIRAASGDAKNDKPTEANLADLDVAEGRYQRAIERFEHARRLAPPKDWSSEMVKAVDARRARSLGIAYLRAGNAAAGRTLLQGTTIAELRDGALRTAEYALRERRALRPAALVLSGAALALRAMNANEADLATLREKLAEVDRVYRETPSPCRDAMPDLLAFETPAARRILATGAADRAGAAAGPPPALAAASDRDGDGIADALDRCPDQAEVYNGVDDADGCPDVAPGYFIGREIRLREQVKFAHDSDAIDASAAPTLDWLAGLLKAHPEIASIAIEGHTDDVGAAAYNLDLSKRRARAIARALESRGAPGSRLRPEGFGMTRPKVLGTDDAARAENRRVEILAQLSGPLVTGPAPAPSALTTSPPAAQGAATATLIVDYSAGPSHDPGAQEWPISFEIDGKELTGAFAVRAGQKNEFKLPPGKVKYRTPSGENMVTLAPNGSTTVSCVWTDATAAVCDEGTAQATKSPPANAAASVIVVHEFGQPVDFTFTVDGRKVSGSFRAPSDKTTTFAIPAGRLRWQATWGKDPCEGGGDEPNPEVVVKPGESATLRCWQSAKMGMCCESAAKAASATKPPAKKPATKK